MASEEFTEKQRKLLKDQEKNNSTLSLKSMHEPNIASNNIQPKRTTLQAITTPGKPKFADALSSELRKNPGAFDNITKESLDPKPIPEGFKNLGAITGEGGLKALNPPHQMMRGDSKPAENPMQDKPKSPDDVISITMHNEGKHPKKEEPTNRFNAAPRQEATPLHKMEFLTKENSDMGWQARLALNKQMLVNQGGTSLQNLKSENDITTQEMQIQGLQDIAAVKQNKAQAENAQKMKARESKNLKSQYDLLATQLEDPMLSADARAKIQRKQSGIGELLQSALQTSGQVEQRKAFEDQASKYLQ